MLFFLVVEAALGAATTALIIKTGQDVSYQEFLISDFVWIVVAPSASYVVGATSWKNLLSGRVLMPMAATCLGLRATTAIILRC